MVGVFQRRTTGSVVCPSCGSLVGVRDEKCYSCGRSNPGLWGFGPALRNLSADFGFAPLVVGTCVTIWVITLLLSGGGIGAGNIMSALSPSSAVLIMFGASGAYPVFYLRRWWTVLSAGWLHAGLLHVAMNMYWVWQMGPAITELFGSARTVIIYTVFGLIGALYHYGRTSSSAVKQMATYIMVQAVVFGLLIPNIDNYAHLGGFIGGYFMSAFLNPMTRERGDHTIIAIACLAASFFALAASILTGLQFFQ